MRYSDLLDPEMLAEWESSTDWKIHNIGKAEPKKTTDPLPDIADDDGTPSETPRDIAENSSLDSIS